LISARYPNPFVLGEQLALIIANGRKKVAEEEVRAFLSNNKFESSLFLPVEEGFATIGVTMESEQDDSFNLKKAKVQKRKFEEHQRVRVNHPTARDYQECGRVIEIKGDPRSGYWYLVMVDGSSAPMWFPQKALGPDEAGIVINPIPEPIEDE